MVTSFHHQPEAQHPKSSDINKLPADYPIFSNCRQILRRSECPLCANMRHQPMQFPPPMTLGNMRANGIRMLAVWLSMVKFMLTVGAILVAFAALSGELLPICSGGD